MDVPRTLLGLPTELRLNIFHRVFRAVVVKVERADYPFPEPPEAQLSPVPTTPPYVIDLKLVCWTFAQEIGYSWHSSVTYSFPSTVAFLDVLSQWSLEQVQAIRHACVYDYPLPLEPYHSYEQLDLKNALPLFPGLQLDSLTVENLWLDPSGYFQDIEATLRVTYLSLLGLATSKGWRRLYYVSGILGLTPSQQHTIEAAIEDLKSGEGNPDLEYGFGRIRPQAEDVEEEEFQARPSDDDEVEEVLRWYDDHPEEGYPRDFPDIDDKQTAFWVRQGNNANYTQDGTPKQNWIEGLLVLKNTNWCEFRRSRGLEHDAMDDAWAYL